MITSLKDENDKIIAYIEWHVLGLDGQFKEQGEVISVQDLWIHDDYRGKNTLNKLIKTVDENFLTWSAQIIVFFEAKYNFRKKLFRRCLFRKGISDGKRKSINSSKC